MKPLLTVLPLLIIFGIILIIVKFVPNKKRSNGVTIISAWFLLQSIPMLRYRPVILGFAFCALFISVAIGLLKLYRPARIAAIAIWIVLFAIQLFGTIISLIAINQKLPESINIDLPKELAQLILCGLILIGLSIFFTRPKVKDQFR